MTPSLWRLLVQQVTLLPHEYLRANLNCSKSLSHNLHEAATRLNLQFLTLPPILTRLKMLEACLPLSPPTRALRLKDQSLPDMNHQPPPDHLPVGRRQHNLPKGLSHNPARISQLFPRLKRIDQ